MTKKQKNNAAPAVLMLMGSNCGYCAPMMQMLTELMKDGHISELRMVNIERLPALAAEYGVRSVPWLQIGAFELSGARTKKEIMLWLERAASSQGMREYLEEVLAEGDLAAANKIIERQPQALGSVLDLMADPDAKINLRLGIGVIIEDVAESEPFKAFIPQLVEYLSHEDARIRADACHYLSLTKNHAYLHEIEKLLSDESEEVREIAQEAVDDYS